MVREQIVTDSVTADLLWKLRHRLEAEGQKNIDIHRLRRDNDYRNQWLAFAADIGTRLRELDTGNTDSKTLPSKGVAPLVGLAVIVHPGLPFEELPTATIAALFSGSIANW